MPDTTANRFIPHPDKSELAIPAPGVGEGFWNGACSAVVVDGVTYLAYRHRQPVALGRGQGVVIARSEDGVHFEQIHMVSKDSMDAESLERPTLIHTPVREADPEGLSRWRLYLSCATTGTKHWRVELLEADSPDAFDPTTRLVVMPGDDQWAVKDTIIQIDTEGLWHCWATFHPLDVKDHEDRMWSKHATSTDGVEWTWQDVFCLEPRDGTWDSRGARITAVIAGTDGYTALYDGRATAAENFEERTGVAVGTSPDSFTSISDDPAAQSTLGGHGLRYADVVPLPDGSYRLYYEIATEDGAHELRTEVI